MSANPSRPGAKGCRRWRAGLAALALACGGMALAQEVVTVPAAHLNHAEGSVAYAPQGEREWQDVQPRRLLKRGDRLWTDRGSRAEVQAGGHALRINGETQLILENVGDTATQLSVTQGSVIATVTRMNPGDSFEVGTPNLAFRARQPGDYRIDVDVKQGVTRVVVASGSGVVYGEKGEALELRSGQRLAFRERNLTRLLQPAFAAVDDFDRWAGARKRGEPTVSMPMVAAAPASAPVAPPDMGRSRTIVISGTAASLKQPAANAPALPPAKAAPMPAVAKSAPPVAPATAQQVSIPAAKPLAAAKVTLPAVPAAAAVTPAVLPPPRARAVATPPPAAAPAANAQVQAQAAAIAQAQAAAQAKAAKAARAEQDRRVAEAKRAEDRRRAVAARRAEDERRRAQARREQEHKRQLAKRAEEERRIAQARRAAEERRLAAARKAEAQKIAESRRQQLARLQEQARREEQSVQARRAEAARRADDERREEQARREEQVRREEHARREEERRQRMLAEQVRRDQQRREEEVWLRQQQPQLIQQPARPQPMGVPARRVS